MATMTEQEWVTNPTVVKTDEPEPSVDAIDDVAAVEKPGTVAAPELTTEESAELAALESIVRNGRAVFMQVAAALVTIRDRRLYRGFAATFEAYCRDRWDMGRSYANRLIRAADVAKDLVPMGTKDLTERQARELAPLTPEDRRAVYGLAKATAPDGKVTAGHLKSLAEVVGDVMRTGAIDDGTGSQVSWADATEDQKKAFIHANVEEETYERYQRQREHNRRILTSSASVDWFTPTEIVSAARDVLGGIDLDPSSCEAANATVQATTYYTVEDDGLTKSWRGTVFLNPPYGGHADAFVAKLMDAYTRGDVPAAIVVLSLHTVSNRWFAPLWNHPVAFIGRLPFDSPDGPSSSPPNGTVIVGVGVDVGRFAEGFRQFGPVVRRIDRTEEMTP